MAHADYPYKFDDTVLPFMSTWNESFGRIVSNNTSEAGSDIETIIRRGKITVKAGCGCFSDMRGTLQSFYNLDSFVLYRYDDIEEGYTTHNVRMTEFSSERVYKSESVDDTKGLWKVSFTLEEF